MGKQELKGKIRELNLLMKSKVDIYNQLETEVSESQKHWLVKQIISVVNPELIKTYKPFNHALILILIVQYFFSFYIFVNSDALFTFSQILLILFATSIYILLIIGMYRVKLIAYNALIVLCTINIAFSFIYLFSSTWVDVIISDIVNAGQILTVIWLQNKMYPEVEAWRQSSKNKGGKILTHS